ncbi:MAG: porin family protein [bacterium]|nr:porin family protein [bacterium]
MKLQAVVLVALLFTPALVSATDKDFYIGASLGEEIFLASDRSMPGADVEGRSYKLFGGLNFGNHFAIELAYHDLGKQVCCADNVADAGYDVDIDGYSANLLARLPVKRFEFFAKLGYLFWDQHGRWITVVGPQPYSNGGNDLMAGAGVEFNMTDHLAVRLEWEHFLMNADEPPFLFEENGDAFSLGILFEF